MTGSAGLPARAAELVDPGLASEHALSLARELGLSLTVADVLRRRGFGADARTRRFLDPKLAQLSSPDAMAGRTAAAERIARALRAREPVAVFGDYDCDGVTSVAILTEVLRVLGGEVTPLLGNRFAGGYGLTDAAVARVQATGARLLVTCDCGSSDRERLARAKAAGIDCIVVDHHEAASEPLPVVAFVNPRQPDCGFGYKGLASCGLVFSLAAAVRKALGRPLDLRRWLDLVAIGTVADVAPLDGDNRALVKVGLEVLALGKRPGLEVLAARSGRGLRSFATAEGIAFQLGPRLNAPGRLGDPTAALELLLAPDQGSALPFAGALEEATSTRRRIQQRMQAEAMALFDGDAMADDAGLVLAQHGWHPGVVGIVAGRIASRTGKPTVLVALDGDVSRGSVRGPPGVRLFDLVQRCAPVLESFGGHQAAAGLDVRTDRVGELRRAWAEACAADPAVSRAAMEEPVRPDARLDERDDLAAVVSDLERLEPCGEGNRAPKLLMQGAVVRSARDLKGHLRLEIEWRGARLGAFLPEKGSFAATLGGRRIDVVGALKRDAWRGGDALEVSVGAWWVR